MLNGSSMLLQICIIVELALSKEPVSSCVIFEYLFRVAAVKSFELIYIAMHLSNKASIILPHLQ